MTEKTALYQDGKLIGYCDEISLKTEFDNTHFAITGFSPTDHQPAFAVGEYYADEEFIYQILEEQEGTDRLVNSFELATGIMHKKLVWTYKGLREPKPATAEQIATFKRAEHFASKGRKLDEFHDRDIVKYEGELFFAKTTSESNLISVSGFDGYGWEDMNADEFELIQTAEELQEVGE